MQTVNIIITLVLYEAVFYTRAYNVSLFLKLLELQLEECSAVSLCTFQSPTSSVELRFAKCCRNCSCDADCVEHDTCCPDIQLRTLIGKDVSNNISELSDRIKYANATMGIQLQEHYPAQKNSSCVQATAWTNMLKQTNFERDNTYRMIVSCPESSMNESEIARKCTDENYQDSYLYEDSKDLNIYIPVTSMKSRKTYQNIYCYWCNEETQTSNSLRQWKARLFCSYDNVDFDCFDPYQCFQMYKTLDYSDCRLSFEPIADVQSLVSRCNFIDFNTCPDNSDEQLSEVCRAFHLPVFASVDYGRFKRYKNIACYLCNDERMFDTTCPGSVLDDWGHEGYGVDLNFQLDENNIIMPYNKSEQNLLNVSIGQDEDSLCATGSVLNSETGVCYRVMCPKLFYPRNGLCYPIFTELKNIYLTVVFDVKRAQNLDQASRTKFRQVFIDRVSAVATDLFQQFSYGLWQIENDHDIFVISFFTFPSNKTYVGMLKAYSEFQKKIGILRIKTKSTSVLTVSTIMNTPGLLYLSGGELKSGGKFLTAIRKYKTMGKRHNEMYISNANLCYRIELRKYEDDRYTANAANRDIQIVSNLKVACIDLVFKNLRNINSSYMFAGFVASLRAEFIKFKKTFKPKPSITRNVDNGPDSDVIEDNDTENDEVSDESKGLFAVLVFLLVITTIGTLKFVKFRKEAQARKRTPDLSEMED